MADPYGKLLDELREELRSGGLESFLTVGNGLVPDQLFVQLEPDDAGRVLHLQLMFLPGMERCPVLQTYIGLPFSFAAEASKDLESLILATNVVTPIGAFGLAAEERLLYFRYNAATPVDPLDVDVLGWTMAMSTYLVRTYGPIIERVSGGGDLVQAFDDLAEAVAMDAAPEGYLEGEPTAR